MSSSAIVNTVSIRCKDEPAILVVYGDDSAGWFTTWGVTKPDIECSIMTINFASLEAIVKSVTPKWFVDMLVTVYSDTRSLVSLSPFEIVYACVRMKSMEDVVRSAEARKYVYMGLMKEAAKLGNESLGLVLRRPDTDSKDDSITTTIAFSKRIKKGKKKAKEAMASPTGEEVSQSEVKIVDQYDVLSE
ncbi:hypothetical protein HRG_001477 [Hirsutella rhossiliensis]|uniref:Uncharacterized protein n=1 Tax=Hirsutella rhossiliensis TaxID=111463 RepID=A0A9P8N8C2_9HYPO|nr:uncharacterized protein HRG_01477 [Hirsutella rhossiliensis]KAH0968835.1 hypothetical protein HRG_01477 [Hirsutella rhossiliensis]